MDKDVAEKILNLMMKMVAQLDDSIAYVRDHDSETVFEAYRLQAAKVMTEIISEVEHPLHVEHPELKPVELGGTYVVDYSIFEPRFYACRGEG